MLLAVNPEMFSQLYDEDGNPLVNEEEIDFEVPSTEADVERMMAQLAEAGIRL